MKRLLTIIALPSLVFLAGESAAGAARRAPLVFAVVVGNNDGLGMLPQLNFADDDALRFYRLATRLAPKKNVALLTELDVDTWRRIQLRGARPPPYLTPTRRKLLEVIKLFKAQISGARKRDPDRPVHFYFFFSGHGEKGYFFLKKKGGPLADSAFTGTDLERTFSDSEATLNWLFIDACKSQSLFFSKGKKEEDDELGPDFSGLISKLDRTVKRAPIGVLTSTVSDKPAGEARDIRGGYFSHVLTSGLRGAADANSDGIIRYGELAAFVSFHTRRIAGQRPWFRPPRGKLDEPLIVLQGRKDLLEVMPGLSGHFAVFDARGRHLIMELHKTSAQRSRLILSPGNYKVVWVLTRNKGLFAKVKLEKGHQRLMLADFNATTNLGPDKVPKGEGLGAPPDGADTPAIASYDPTSSGFDQPFTPRIVSAMATAYNSGLSVTAGMESSGDRSKRHALSVGYGMYSPPAHPLTAGHGLSLAYGYRFGIPLAVGARAVFGFSDHESPSTDAPFKMQRIMLQAEGAYLLPLGKRLMAGFGLYLGWQVVMITQEVLMREGEKERLSTVLSGDEAGFRAGLTMELRLNITPSFWASVTAAGGVELVHQEDLQGESQAEAFLRPQVSGQVGYAF